jgi:hypothetical protein
MMHGREKSDSAIVAVKPANKVERSAAEPVEPRAETKGNGGQQSTRRTQSRISVSKALVRIRQIVAVDTRGGSRMRESRTYGFERGARGSAPGRCRDGSAPRSFPERTNRFCRATGPARLNSAKVYTANNGGARQVSATECERCVAWGAARRWL